MGAASDSAWTRRAPWIAGLLLAAPILALRYPPMGDLAMHEALVAILRHWRDPAWAPPGLYSVVAPQANQLFQLLAAGLAYVLGRTDLACKVLVAAIVAGSTVVTARSLARSGRAPIAALLVAPIVCGWMFTWGLVANMLGFVLLAASFPLAESVARRPTRRSVVAATATVCVLFFAHESTALSFALILGVLSVVRASRPLPLLARSAPIVVTLALAIAQWRASRGLVGANMAAIGNDYGDDPAARLGMLPGALFGGVDQTNHVVLAALLLVAVVMGALANRGLARRRVFPLRVALWRYRHAVLAALFLVLFLGFPMSLGGNTLLAHRFLPVAALFLVVACAPRVATRRYAIVATLVPLVTLGLLARTYAENDRRQRDLDAVLAHLPMGVAVAQLDLTPLPSGRVAPVPGLASRAQAERGGRMLFALTDMPPNPIYVRADARWNEPMLRLAHAPFAFMPTHDARRFAYLLTLNRSPAGRPRVRAALAPEDELVASEGEWDLYRSTLPTVPLDAPDAPLPSPPPETLADRVNRHAIGAVPAR